MLPPTDLRLRNERGEFERLLAEFDRLPLADAAEKQETRALASPVRRDDRETCASTRSTASRARATSTSVCAR